MKKLFIILAVCLASANAAYAQDDAQALQWKQNGIINISGQVSEKNTGLVTAILYDGENADDANIKYIGQCSADENGDYRLKFRYSGDAANLSLLMNIDGYEANNTVKTAETEDMVFTAEPVLTLRADGTMRARVDFSNYFNLEKTYKILAAFYNGDNRMTGCDVSDTSKVLRDASNPYMELEAPDGTEYCKVYVWNSENTPLSEPVKKSVHFKQTIQAYSPSSSDINSQTIKINCLGDSITWGVGTDKQYHKYFEDYFLCDVKNYGVSGTTISTYLGTAKERTDGSFYLRSLNMSDDADLVTVLGGVNDYNQVGTKYIGTVNDRTDSTFCGSYRLLIERLLEKYPKAQIVCFTPLREKHGEQRELSLYADAIKEICSDYNIDVIDLFNAEGLDFSADAELMPDGLHPGTEAHGMIAEYIVSELQKCGMLNINN